MTLKQKPYMKMTIDERYKNNYMSHYSRKIYEHQQQRVENWKKFYRTVCQKFTKARRLLEVQLAEKDKRIAELESWNNGLILKLAETKCKIEELQDGS